jgi:ParB-like chromosome segregation protein Spo0J
MSDVSTHVNNNPTEGEIPSHTPGATSDLAHVNEDTPMKNYEPHEFANVFPLREGPPLWELSDHIRANGLQEAIMLFEGKVLDGRRRQLACLRAKVAPRYAEYKGTPEEALRYVIGKNLHRRHLGESERAMVAAKIATLQQGFKRQQKSHTPIGGLRDTPSGTPSTQRDAAEVMSVGKRSVQRARVVLEKGTPELQQAVENGTLSVSDAANVAKEEPAVQAAAVEAVRSGQARTASAAAKKGLPRDSSRNGKPLFDVRLGNDLFGKLRRFLDDCARFKGRCREHDRCIELLAKAFDEWQQWQARISL